MRNFRLFLACCMLQAALPLIGKHVAVNVERWQGEPHAEGSERLNSCTVVTSLSGDFESSVGQMALDDDPDAFTGVKLSGRVSDVRGLYQYQLLLTVRSLGERQESDGNLLLAFTANEFLLKGAIGAGDSRTISAGDLGFIVLTIEDRTINLSAP